jgi:endonuclease/exonuclease/phosphatase family metal-dependent hydrolase
LRRHIANTPGLADTLARLRPEGPLVVSHLVKPTNKPVRYDHVWVTDDIDVVRVRYLHRSAVRAGSDHAAIVAVIDTATSALRAA